MICYTRITCYKSLGRATHRLRTAQVPYTGGQIPLMKPRYRGSHLFIPPTLPRSRQANNAIQPCCADAPNRNYIVEWKVFTRCAFTFLSPIYHNTQPLRLHTSTADKSAAPHCLTMRSKSDIWLTKPVANLLWLEKHPGVLFSGRTRAPGDSSEPLRLHGDRPSSFHRVHHNSVYFWRYGGLEESSPSIKRWGSAFQNSMQQLAATTRLGVKKKI